jgi:hypothetical protein
MKYPHTKALLIILLGSFPPLIIANLLPAHDNVGLISFTIGVLLLGIGMGINWGAP